MSRAEALARRYVAWLRRRWLAVIAAHVLVVGLAGYLIAFHLPLYADFSYLLPQDAPSVKDLRKLESRVKATDTVLVVVTAPSPDARAAAVTEMTKGIRALPEELVEVVEDDDVEIRDYLRAHRFLFVSLEDLKAAEAALESKITEAKKKANPLYVQLEDPDPAVEKAQKEKLDELRAKRKEADAKLAKSSHISPDGTIAMIEVRIGFRPTDAGKGEELIAELERIRAGVLAAHPGVDMGFTGGIITGVSEHRAISHGIVLSSIVTTLLVGIVLVMYFRSAKLLAMLSGTIVVATAAAFGAAAITIGHLNAATAFLGAIIAGNGINYGILLIARFLEERRKRDVDSSLAVAIAGTLKPTAIASLGAAIAYGSLAATSFKGFADFAVIGAIGMVLCWVASYSLLPALVLAFGARRDPQAIAGDVIVGAALVKAIGFRRSGMVCAVIGGIALGATGIVAKYVIDDPFEYDMKKLRSEGQDAIETRRWMKKSDDTFGRGFAGRMFIAAERPDQVPQIVAALKAIDAGVPPEKTTLGPVRSILDVVPDRQAEKLAVLAKIRKLLDDKALNALEDGERAELKEMRPPDDLNAISVATLPPALRDRPEITEADGRTGLMISIHHSNYLDEWNGHDLVRFASAVRRLELKDHEVVTTSGSSVIFADILDAVEHDGPVVTGVAAVLLVAMVLLLVGFNRRALAVLLATGAGSLLMVATCALLGLKVNFLDFVALPITLGLGIDYAINIAHRQDSSDESDPIETLRTSGSAVFVCSLTTMIGYGSLLVSDNLAIRGFGTASLIGEVMCVTSALVFVPALLAFMFVKKPAPAAPAEPKAAA